MTPRPKSKGPTKDALTTFRLGYDMYQSMLALRERDGMPFSVQIRRALEVFLKQKGVWRAKPDRTAKRESA
jgi:hypothetical protein